MIEAMETEIAEMKKALKVRHDKVCIIHNVAPHVIVVVQSFSMKARSSEGPAGMVFDAVFNTPDVGSAAAVVADPPPQPVKDPPKQEVSGSFESEK